MSSVWERLPTLVSEQTANARNGTSASLVHSRRAWLISEMDGTRNSTDVGCALPALPSVASCSAILSAVNVLPVPQAMISLPRSWVWKPANTSASACFWWGRRRFLVVVGRIDGRSKSTASQSMSESSRSARPIRDTGICWPTRAASALLLHRSVVETISRLAKPALPDAVKNESRCALSR
jgi:hypothetical protein